MIDLDGTVYKGGNVIPGAQDLIKFLKKEKIPFVFLTNNSSDTRDYYFKKLTSMGFPIARENILTSTTAAVRFLKERRAGKNVYVIATPDVADEIADMGVPNCGENPDIVLLTFDRTITFDKINKAYRHIMDGSELIATHPDDLCPTEDGYDVDIGQFIKMLSHLTGAVPTVIGKPNSLMLEMAAEEMGADKSRTLMVGDRLYTDIAMAAYAGTDSVLVLTGETQMSDLDKSEVKPTYVVGSVVEIPDLITKLCRDR
jgi:HAD superfamily hydrolase (TIGR01457 family)